MTCLIKSTNNAVFEDLVGKERSYDNVDDKMWKRLIRLFGKKQLFLIENVFENWKYEAYQTWTKGKMDSFGYQLTSKDKERVNFSNKNKLFPKKADDRMIAIMKNIIRNKGKFIPEQG